MTRRIFVLLSAVMVFASGVVACGPPGPTPTPLPLQAPGWEDVTVHTLCLKVEQSYPEIEGKEPEPIAETVQRILAGIGVEVVAEEAQCDATLTVTLTGQDHAAYYIKKGSDYSGAPGTGDYYCHSGADVQDQMGLAVPGREPFTVSSSGYYDTPFEISSCASQPYEAPFEKAWPEALFDGLAQLWGPRVLIQVLRDGDAVARKAAADVLREIGPEAKEAVPALIQALRDGDADVRVAAADALRDIGPEAKEAVPALIQALRDGDADVRVAAAYALVWTGPKEEVLPLLIQALRDRDAVVRSGAAYALRWIGPEEGVVPALIQALRDEDQGVVGAAYYALVNITGQDFQVDAAAWQEWWEEQE